MPRLFVFGCNVERFIARRAASAAALRNDVRGQITNACPRLENALLGPVINEVNRGRVAPGARYAQVFRLFAPLERRRQLAGAAMTTCTFAPLLACLVIVLLMGHSTWLFFDAASFKGCESR